MAVKLTKEMVLNAIAKGKVSYNLRGNSESFTPARAKSFLLKKIDDIEQGEKEIDLSLAFDHDPIAMQG